MTHYIPPTPEFGEPDHVYDGPASLIAAVTAYPKKFSQDTHALVERLMAEQISINPTQDGTRSIDTAVHITQPTQTSIH